MNVIVSGSTGGIGYAIACGLAKAGCDVVIHSRDVEKSKQVSEQISEDYKVRSMAVSGDLSNPEDVKEIYRALQTNDFLPDVLVNNAGKYYSDSVSNHLHFLQKALHDNLFSAHHLTDIFLPHFQQIRKGHIVNICSIVSREHRSEAASYSIAKAALDAYTKLLRLSVKEFNVKVTAIFPGSVYTPSWDGTGVNPSFIIPPSALSSLVELILNQADSVEINEIHLKAFNFD